MSLVRVASLGPGFLQDANGNALVGRTVNVYVRDTATPVQVYQDEAGTIPLSQPLVTGSDGSIPGFVVSGQSIDLADVFSGLRMQAEPIYASDSGRLQHWLGMNGNSLAGYGPIPFWSELGFSLDRQEVRQPASAALSTIAAALSNGMTRIVFPIDETNYGTASAFPTDATVINNYASYFVNVVQQIEAAFPGVGLYEIINESWFFYTPGATAATYADLVVVVLQACQSARLDMTRIYPVVKDQSWPAAMIAEQPVLANLIAGWCIHPYGSPPPGSAQSTTQGIAAVPYFRDQLTVGQNNILISEVGIWDYSVSAANAASESTAATGAQAQRWAQQIMCAAQAMHDAGWLTALLWYSRNDTGWAANALGGALTSIGTALAQFPLDAEQFVTSGYSVQDDGWVAVNMDPYIAKDGVQLTAGKVHLFRVRVDNRTFAQHLTVYLDTIGATLTAGQCFAGIYDAFGNLLVATADQSTTWAASAGRVQMSFTGHNFKPGFWYIALGANGTTMPKFRGALVGDQAWMGSSAALPTRQMITTASFTTALPSTINLTSGVSRSSSGILVALQP